MMHDSSCGCSDCRKFHPLRFREQPSETMTKPHAAAVRAIDKIAQYGVAQSKDWPLVGNTITAGYAPLVKAVERHLEECVDRAYLQDLRDALRQIKGE